MSSELLYRPPRELCSGQRGSDGWVLVVVMIEFGGLMGNGGGRVMMESEGDYIINDT